MAVDATADRPVLLQQQSQPLTVSTTAHDPPQATHHVTHHAQMSASAHGILNSPVVVKPAAQPAGVNPLSTASLPVLNVLNASARHSRANSASRVGRDKAGLLPSANSGAASAGSPGRPKAPLKWGHGGSAVAPSVTGSSPQISYRNSLSGSPAVNLAPLAAADTPSTPVPTPVLLPLNEEPTDASATSSFPPTPASASAPEPGKRQRMSVRSRSSDQLMGRRMTRQRSEKEVLVGTPVKEGHANYMLMYDMLTGIRVSVSRCNARPARELDAADFAAAHKLAFDVTGNEMTPSSRYDFKFKDYAPWVFRRIRELFHVDANEYLLSLTGKYVLSELGSPGKSGSFFYFSQDYRFIIKTIHHSEHKFMRDILREYHDHLAANPETLLSRIFGLHRVKLPGNRKIHFVVMGNVFPANKDIHETYDLKGSTVGRLLRDEEMKKNPIAVLKDLNWLQRNRKLRLGPLKRELFVTQMEKDVAFLTRMNIMDYSLLVGYHDLVKGNADNIRDATLAVFEPNADALLSRGHPPLPSNASVSVAAAASATPTASASFGGSSSAAARDNHLRRGSKASTMRRLLAESDPVRLGPSSSRLPEDLPPERRCSVFYRDMGGFRATGFDDEDGMEVYYVGIIDIFTKYDGKKKLEHVLKSIGANSKKISAVKPSLYGARFSEFMKDAIAKPGDPPASPISSPISAAFPSV
ncbi:Phosphatidylinositol-4-phosphate 5-kinase [Irineochytrium annulatum]|nr:Phosphatidylinositol-4-phosphate 5-kinase [Irineochytrium annulatum]